MKLSPFVMIGGALLICLALLSGSAQGQASCPAISSFVVSAWEEGFDTTTCTKICKPGRIPGKFGYCHQCSQQDVECPANKTWSSHTCQCECAPGYHPVAYANGTLSDECAPQGTSCLWEIIMAAGSSSPFYNGGSGGEETSPSSGGGNGGNGDNGGNGGNGDGGSGGEESSSSSGGGYDGGYGGYGGSSGGSSSGGYGGSSGGGKRDPSQVQDEEYYGPEIKDPRQWGGSSGSGASGACASTSDSTGNSFGQLVELPGLGMPGVDLPCGLHRIYDPVNCTCKCSPFWKGPECGSCWFGNRDSFVSATCAAQLTLKFPFVSSPNEVDCSSTSCYLGLGGGYTGPGANPGCNLPCRDLWTRDPETALCTVCNPPRGTCPGFQVVDYTTCTCVEGPAPPTGLASSTEEAESLLNCGPGEPNSGGTGCICPLGFIGSRCDATKWTKLASGSSFTCGLTEEGTVHCWQFSDDEFSVLSFAPSFQIGTVRDMALGGDRICVIKLDQTVTCYDVTFASDQMLSTASSTYNSPVYSVATNGETFCVVTKPNRTVVCQGGDLAEDVDFSTGVLDGKMFASVTVGQDYVCALVHNGTNVGGLACRGSVFKNPGQGDYYINVKAAPSGDKGRLCVTKSTMGQEMYTACWAEDVGNFTWVTNGQLTTSPTTLPDQPGVFTQYEFDWSMGGSAWVDVNGNNINNLYHNGAIKGGSFASTAGNLGWAWMNMNEGGWADQKLRYVDIAATENYVCALVAGCAGLPVDVVRGNIDCYCPLFRDGPTCQHVDCDRYWISSNVVRSYVHTDYMKYCNMSQFNEPFCVFLQYFLDTNEAIHNEMARNSRYGSPDMSKFPHPAQCPPAQLTFNHWKAAWEECSGLDIMTYCDAVLLSPKDLRRMIVPFNEYRSDAYDEAIIDLHGVTTQNTNRYQYDMREIYSRVFSNEVDIMIEGLEYRVGEDAPMYKCLIEKLGTTAWEPEMFSGGCSSNTALLQSTALGSTERKQYTVDLLYDLYGIRRPTLASGPPSPSPVPPPLSNPANRPYDPTCNAWSFKAVPDDLNNPPGVDGMLGCTPEGGLDIVQQNSNANRFVFESGGDLRVPYTNPWSTIYSVGCNCVISSLNAWGMSCTTDDEQFSAMISFDSELNAPVIQFQSYNGVLSVAGYQYWSPQYRTCP